MCNIILPCLANEPMAYGMLSQTRGWMLAPVIIRIRRILVCKNPVYRSVAVPAWVGGVVVFRLETGNMD